MWLKIFKEVMGLLVIALSLAGAGYALRPVIFPSATTHPVASEKDADGVAFTTITLEDTLAHFEKGDALFADARSKRTYSKGHIKGAINLDPNEFDTWSGDFFSRISPDQVIVTYCEGSQCRLSMELAEKLTWMGYEKVFYLKDGWGLWKKHQLPIDQSTQ